MGGRNFGFYHQMSHVGVDIALAYMEVGNSGVVPYLKPHGTPYSAENKTRPPIPSVLVGRLAQIGFLGRLRLVAPEVSGRDFPRLRDRRREDDAQLIRPRFQLRLHLEIG